MNGHAESSSLDPLNYAPWGFTTEGRGRANGDEGEKLVDWRTGT